jgi:chromosome segregation protein
MHLKRLELSGFKSFAQKTVLDFSDGIAAIVGPNGSGKSNIIDAIRWLLGEREAKNIRGGKAEDLIFAGTPERPRIGMASASILLDNQIKFFPVDFSEILINRRVTRDGNSEYFLNNASIRLKDVIDFFAKSRLGTKGFSIINQGNSDIFVKVSPKERRELLEEILGLRQFQLKKNEAERRLKNTKINLEKTQAVINEITPHLRMLRRQTKKWQNFDNLKKELKELGDRYFGFKFKKFDNEFKTIDPEIKKIDDLIGIKKKELKILNDKFSQIENKRPEENKDYVLWKKQQEEFLNRRSNILKELGRLEARVEFFSAQPKTEFSEKELVSFLGTIKQEIKNALNEINLDGLKRILENLIHRIDSFFEGEKLIDKTPEIKNFEASKNKLAEELKMIDAKLAEGKVLENKLTTDLKEFNTVFKQALEVFEAKKDEIAELDNQKNKSLLAKEKINLELSELENQIIGIGRTLEEFKILDIQPVSDAELQEIDRRIFRLRAEIAGIGEIDEALIKEAQTTEERYNFLTHQIKDLEKASSDLNILIKDLSEKIQTEFSIALKAINEKFNEYFRLMFDGGRAKLHLVKAEKPILIEAENNEAENNNEIAGETEDSGIEIELSIPKKKIKGLDMLSGGERSLVSIVALFALISISPPPFLVLDEVDAALDERNSKKFASLIKNFSKNTQFIIVTHNRSTMEVADVLYGVTMAQDGTSKVLSLKFEEAPIEVDQAQSLV